MNFVVVDVKNRRKTDYPNMNVNKGGDPKVISAVNARMLTVEEYHELARRIIGKWAPAHAKAAMLNSEDAIDFVAHHIMVGDWAYDDKKSEIQTYRGYCGKMAISDYLDTLSKQKTFLTNCIYGLHDNNTFDTTDPNAQPPENYEMYQEARDEDRKQLDVFMGDLNETQRNCITMHFIEDMTMIEIARELDMSREGVRRAIEEGMKNIKRMAGLK